jgi:hypothetical protein
MNTLQLMQNYGIKQRRQAVLPTLARDVLNLTIAGKLQPDDANDMYMAYITKSLNVRTMDTTAGSFKANASKLRQIIAWAREQRAQARVIFDRALSVRVKLEKRGVSVLPEYPAIVNLARAALASKRRLTLKQIEKVVRK